MGPLTIDMSPTARPGCSLKYRLMLTVSSKGRGLDPLGKLVVGKRDGLGAAAQQQDVAQRLGSRLAPERLGRQAHRAQELGLLGQGAAGRGRVLVERVAAGEHRDEAAGAHRLDALPDEVVVDRHAVDLDIAGCRARCRWRRRRTRGRPGTPRGRRRRCAPRGRAPARCAPRSGRARRRGSPGRGRRARGA